MRKVSRSFKLLIIIFLITIFLFCLTLIYVTNFFQILYCFYLKDSDTQTFLEIIKIIISAIVPLIALILFFMYGKLIQQSEARKSIAIGEVSFHYDSKCKIYNSGEKRILDLEVKITNISSRKLGIPAIFVMYRPIINIEKLDDFAFTNFNSLKEFEFEKDYEKSSTLLQTKNIAAAKGFFWQTSVGGISVRRGFDSANQDFCLKYPLVLVKIIIYGTSIDDIDKTSFPRYEIGKLRIAWCDYLDEKNKENYDFFGRWEKENLTFDNFSIKKGERILINKDGSIDLENTKKFFSILKSIVNSIIEKVIKF